MDETRPITEQTKAPGIFESTSTLLKRTDRVALLFIAIIIILALLSPTDVWPVITDVIGSLSHTAIFIIFAVLLIAWLQATEAQALVGAAFQGRERNMIVLAAIVGGIAPFCSCEVIPFIAALLAAGTPLSAVMAFWLASPIMDPPMFAITAGALGIDFAIAKTLAAVCFGLFGGFSMMALGKLGMFSDALKNTVPASCGSSCTTAKSSANDSGGCDEDAFNTKVVWKFWQHPKRVKQFFTVAKDNSLFLLKWMALAYLIQALMSRFIPDQWIATALGGDGIQPIALAALLGGPAYLNGYAAVPLVQGLLQQGMSNGAAMSFVLAGSVTCIPAAIAVWAMVKPRVFAAYISFGIGGSFVAGLLWAAYV